MCITLSRFLLFTFLSLLAFEVDASVERLRCMWRNDPATTMVIGWDQITGNNPVLHYDDIDWGMDVMAFRSHQSPDRSVASKGMNNKYVRLKNLKPNTVYYFFIVDGNDTSAKYSFKTAPDNSQERLSVVAGGDSRNYRDARRNANKLVARLNPDCVMFGGDMTGGDTAKEWIEWFDDWQHTVHNGRLIPIIATRGNHEYSNKTIYNLFDTPSEKIYYGLTLGGDLLRIYTLNSLIASGGDQKQWLESDLNSNQHCLWKFAQYHFAIRPHTRGKSERNSQLKNWSNLFYTYGLKLAMESDAHVVKVTHPISPSRESGSDEGFIRDDERGTVYVGEGCWGAPIRKNNDDKNWTKASGSFNQFKWIFVDQHSVEVRTIKTDNADMVDFVYCGNRFYPPTNLDIWDANGEPVTYLNRSNTTFVKTESTTPPVTTMTSANSMASTTIVTRSFPVKQIVKLEKPMEVYECKVATTTDQKIISWKTMHEYKGKVVFEVQRSADGKDYQTFAIVNNRGGAGDKGVENNYKINDDENYALSNLTYRVREVQPSGTVIFHKVKSEPTKKESLNQIVNTNQLLKKNVLSPDPETGLLKVKYNLENPSDVRIRLVDAASESKEFAKSNYINQKSGNYLKSIDMSNMPKGNYLLIIRKENEIDEIAIEKA